MPFFDNLTDNCTSQRGRRGRNAQVLARPTNIRRRGYSSSVKGHTDDLERAVTAYAHRWRIVYLWKLVDRSCVSPEARALVLGSTYRWRIRVHRMPSFALCDVEQALVGSASCRFGMSARIHLFRDLLCDLVDSRARQTNVREIGGHEPGEIGGHEPILADWASFGQTEAGLSRRAAHPVRQPKRPGDRVRLRRPRRRGHVG